MIVKVCGITNREDALNAIALGASALGFIFYKKSPRYVSPEKVQEITYFLPPFISLVGVFVNESPKFIDDVMRHCKLNLAQLHGDEKASDFKSFNHRFIKAFAVESNADLSQISPFQGHTSAILLDKKCPGLYGGTGETFDWGLALEAKLFSLPIILSGGISASNVLKARELVNPYAVDICSAFESEPGLKDYNKMAEFFKNL